MLASSRKGTHLLDTALAQHPEIMVYDQPFSGHGSGSPYHPELAGDALANLIFAGRAVVILCLGWMNARGRNPDFWDELRMRGVGVIHLHRRNMLRWHVSCLLALAGNQWISLDKPKPTTCKIQIDIGALRRAIYRDLREERQAARFFQGHRQLHLWYEDMTAHYDAQIVRIQSFLGVTPQLLRPTCYKQQVRPLSDVIENYGELADQLAGTPWEWFLRDDPCEAVAPEKSVDHEDSL